MVDTTKSSRDSSEGEMTANNKQQEKEQEEEPSSSLPNPLEQPSKEKESNNKLPPTTTERDNNRLDANNDNDSDTSRGSVIHYQRRNTNRSSSSENNHGSWTPLHTGVSNNDIDLVEFWLSQGADPNVIDSEGKKPLYYSQDRAITSLLLKHGSHICHQMDWDAKDKVLNVAFRKLHPENDQCLLLKLLEDCMEDINRKSMERRTVFILMGWLTFQCTLFSCYIYVVVKTSSGTLLSPNSFPIIYIYVAASIFLCFEFGEFATLASEGAEILYLNDTWKWINLISFTLILSSTTMIRQGGVLLVLQPGDGEGGGNDPTAQDEDAVKGLQNLVIVTVAFVCVSVLGDLKTTFLPFSIFVGGVTQIVYDLIPFLTVSFLVLLAFSLMYFVQGPTSYSNNDNVNDEPSFQDAFFFVFANFAGGFEEADSYLDIIFGVVLVIILFNVVIAIVSSSWQSAVNASFINLCRHRIEVIRRAEVDKKSSDKLGCFQIDWIDQEFWIDRFGAKLDAWGRKSKSQQSKSRVKQNLLVKFVLYVGGTVVRILFWILGIVTFGILWPARIRQQLFQIDKGKDTMGMNVDTTAAMTTMIEEEVSNLHVKLEKQYASLDGRVERLERRLDGMASKLDMLLDYMVAQSSSNNTVPSASNVDHNGPDSPLPSRTSHFHRTSSG